MTTPVSRSTIFIAKLVVLTKSILAAQVLFDGVYHYRGKGCVSV